VFFNDNQADSDQDGILDINDLCPLIANPDPRESCGAITLCDDGFTGCLTDSDCPGQTSGSCTDEPAGPSFDCDGDGIGDVCDGFVCGDGEPQSAEECEFAEPAGPGLGCTDECTLPTPEILPTEASINTGQQGNAVFSLQSSPFVDPAAGPVDLLSLRLFAVDPALGVPTEAGCLAVVQAAEDDGDPDTPVGIAHPGIATDPSGHLSGDENGDGISELRLHFPVPGSGMTPSTTHICIRGSLNTTPQPHVFAIAVDVSANIK
jgi:hypothetical protein